MRKTTIEEVLVWLVLAWLIFGDAVPIIGGVPTAALIVYETADTTPAQARLITALRNKPHSDSLKGIQLDVLDDDAVDADGKPLARLEKFKPYSLPELLVLGAHDSLLKRQKLPETPEAVVAAVKGN